MPGPYAHITLLHELLRPGSWLESSLAPSSRFSDVLNAHFPYCALGAVSPDYPNLAGGDSDAPHWADAMHYTRASEMITSGITRIRDTTGSARDKQLSWLLGYCAHVVADVTIHPVVQAMVGVYAENQRNHRVCEMNQDSYIFHRMNAGEIGESDAFAQTVAHCCNPGDRFQLDRDIVTLWEEMLADVHPEVSGANPADSSSWHRGFMDRLDECQAKTVRLFPLAANIAAKLELSYPRYDQVDRHFIEDQPIPSERRRYLHYDDIFDHAAGNIVTVWRHVEQAVCNAETSGPARSGDWNLDTGRDEYGRLVFWE